MAPLMSSNIAGNNDMDDMDIDIDMNIDDVGGPMDEALLEDGEALSVHQPSLTDTSSMIPAIYTEDSAQEPQWQKIHIRGVDDLHTNDILGFAKDCFPAADPHVQWVDDTSANVVFKTSEDARQAFLAFVETPTNSDQIQNNPFEMRTAKPLASRPATLLTMRIAQVGDRKKKNARDASRYYLMHPDEDPTERMRKEFANGRADSGDYRRRRFDDHEHRRRRDKDHNTESTGDFAASMYDDAPVTEAPKSGARGRELFPQKSKPSRRRSASPGAINSDAIDISDSDNDQRARRRRNEYRDRTDWPRREQPSNVGKELFSESNSSSSSRKQGGLYSNQMDLYPTSTNMTARPAGANADVKANAAAARRLRADLLSAAQTSPRSHHRRSHAIDAKNAEDLSERFARKSISIDSTKSIKTGAGIELFPASDSGRAGFGRSTNNGDSGFSIKGQGGLNIKGRAEVKELFPAQYTRNEGKELFDQPVRERGPRKRAGDLFD